MQLLLRIVKRFRGGLVFKARGPFHHSTLDSRVIKKKTEVRHPGQSVSLSMHSRVLVAPKEGEREREREIARERAR